MVTNSGHTRSSGIQLDAATLPCCCWWCLRVTVRSSFYGNWPGPPTLVIFAWISLPDQTMNVELGTTHYVLIYPPKHFEFGISDTYTNFTHTTYLLTGHYRYTKKWNKHCLWSSSFLLGSEFLTNENGVQMVLCFLLCCTFKFSYCYLIY